MVSCTVVLLLVERLHLTAVEASVSGLGSCRVLPGSAFWVLTTGFFSQLPRWGGSCPLALGCAALGLGYTRSGVMWCVAALFCGKRLVAQASTVKQDVVTNQLRRFRCEHQQAPGKWPHRFHLHRIHCGGVPLCCVTWWIKGWSIISDFGGEKVADFDQYIWCYASRESWQPWSFFYYSVLLHSRDAHYFQNNHLSVTSVSLLLLGSYAFL